MTVTVAAAPARVRLASLDRARGLAILLMVLDHAVLVAGHGGLIRGTVTRAAMPLFFLVGGALIRSRLGPRHLLILGAGLLLPYAVPWVERPNILVLYVAGAAVVAGVNRWCPPGWRFGILAVLLTLAANGWTVNPYGYDAAAVMALLVVGNIAGPSLLGWADRLPGWVGVVGRYPLSIYLGHLLALHAAASWARGSWSWWPLLP